jgi:hypothetical protein|mmetsp:Transcript_31922/g.51534  ORF Transcript_31922/g.51534 Transcript_31922/m.51534 type:complete len:209 (-) Transcript_31922:3-629(-)
MYYSTIEIESRRMEKIIIQKIHTKFFCSMIRSINLNILPKKLSWVFLNKKNLFVKSTKIEKFKKLIGYIIWDENSNRYFNTTKNTRYWFKNLDRFKYPIFSDFSFPSSNFTFVDIKMIDSFFQIKKKFIQSFPILFSIENFYGLLFSLAEFLKILFKKFIQTSNVHKICFNSIKKLIFKFNKAKTINFTNLKINSIVINTILKERKLN